MIEREGLARLDFIQNMEYKFVELLSCNFIASPEDVIRAHICFRYNTLKSRLALVQSRLQDIESLIKVPPPSLSLLSPLPQPPPLFLPFPKSESPLLSLGPSQVKNPSLLLQLSKPAGSRGGKS